MPDIDLGPNSYRKQIKGRWHLPDDPKLCRNLFFVAALVLVLIFFWRSELSTATLFGVAVMFSFFAGIAFAIWKRDVY